MHKTPIEHCDYERQNDHILFIVWINFQKPERYWVVFCVHDDCEALLEGYGEPRNAASHSPDWTVSLQTTLHISHTLVPSENEYEFVITLTCETVRFIASSWEIMQEWVDTLRLKLREMKILSPKENLYSKLPEVRPPLLPTRDPMSPLPATPPVPAALVPGVERIVNNIQTSRHVATTVASTPLTSTSTSTSNTNTNDSAPNGSSNVLLSDQMSNSNSVHHSVDNNYVSTQVVNAQSTSDSTITIATASISTAPSTSNSSSSSSSSTSSLPASSMSNTLTQNLIKMLYPVTTYSHQANSIYESDTASNALSELDENNQPTSANEFENSHQNRANNQIATEDNDENSSLARTFTNNVLADPNTCTSNSSSLSSYVLSNKRDIADGKRIDLLNFFFFKFNFKC